VRPPGRADTPSTLRIAGDGDVVHEHRQRCAVVVDVVTAASHRRPATPPRPTSSTYDAVGAQYPSITVGSPVAPSQLGLQTCRCSPPSPITRSATVASPIDRTEVQQQYHGDRGDHRVVQQQHRRSAPHPPAGRRRRERAPANANAAAKAGRPASAPGPTTGRRHRRPRPTQDGNSKGHQSLRANGSTIAVTYATSTVG